MNIRIYSYQVVQISFPNKFVATKTHLFALKGSNDVCYISQVTEKKREMVFFRPQQKILLERVEAICLVNGLGGDWEILEGLAAHGIGTRSMRHVLSGAVTLQFLRRIFCKFFSWYTCTYIERTLWRILLNWGVILQIFQFVKNVSKGWGLYQQASVWLDWVLCKCHASGVVLPSHKYINTIFLNIASKMYIVLCTMIVNSENILQISFL